MGFKMKGFNAGKGTGSASSFTYGEYIPQSDGSVIWQPTKEERVAQIREENANYVPPPKEKTKWEKKTEKAIAKYEKAKRNFDEVPYSVLRILNQYDPDWLSKQNYHTLSNIDNVGGLDFDDNVKRYDRKGRPKINRKNKRYNKFRNMGMSHEEAMLKANIKFDPKTDDSTTHRSDHRQTENQWEDDPNIVVDSNYDDPNTPKPRYVAPELTQEEIEEIERIDAETAAIDNEEGGEGEGEGEGDNVNVNEFVDNEVSIGDDEGDANDDVSDKTFDPADTNEDGVIDRWEEKAAKRAAMFTKKSNPHQFDSPEWWDWKNASNVAKSNTKKSAFTVLSKYGKKWI
tara:strand:- start:659 stop:1687 length:1029 start_codon:yes stop_codon:yes gene_type:complete